MQRQRRLTGAEVDELAAQYRQGFNMTELAERWGICRRTVGVLLRGAGVELRGRSKLTDSQVAEIARLRSQGWKLGELAKRFGVSDRTISAILAKG